MLTSEGLKSSLFSLFSLLLLQVSVSVVAAQPADDANFDHLAACRMAGTPISVCLNQYDDGPGPCGGGDCGVSAGDNHPDKNVACSEPGSFVDNSFYNYHHYAVDYQVGSSSGCGSCGASSTGSEGLPELKIQRRHRYRDMTWGGSFGPGVFLDTYDIRLTIFEKEDQNCIDLFVPENSAAIRLVNDSTDSSTTGVFKDLRHNLYRDAQMFDALEGGNTTSDLSQGKRIVFTAYTGKTMEFEMFELQAANATSSQSAEYGGRLIQTSDRNGYGYALTYRDDDWEPEELAQAPDRRWQIKTIRDAYQREATIYYHDLQVAGCWVVSRIVPPNGHEIRYVYGDEGATSFNGQLSSVVHPDGTVSTITYGTEEEFSQTTTVAFNDASASGTHRNKTAYLSNNMMIDVRQGGTPAESVPVISSQSSLMVRIVVNGEGEVAYLNIPDPTNTFLNNLIYEGSGRARVNRLAFRTRYFDGEWSPDTLTDLTPDGRDLAMQTESVAERNIVAGPEDAWEQTYPTIQTKTGERYSYEYYDGDDGGKNTGTMRSKTYSDGTSERWERNNPFELVTRYEDRLKRVTLNRYDDWGNLEERTVGYVNISNDPNLPIDQPVSEDMGVYRYEYYPAGDPNQFLLKFKYDANNNRTQYVYNDRNLLIEVIEPDDTGAGFHTAATYEYDGAARKTKSVDAIGRITLFDYDRRNRNVRTTYNDGSTEETLHAAPGSGRENLVLARKDRNGNVTTYEYDEHGRQMTMVVGHINVGDLSILGAEFDSTEMVDHDAFAPGDIPASASVETCTYLDGTNLRSSCTRNGELTEYQYDYRHRLIRTTVHTRDGQALVSTKEYLNNLLFSTSGPYPENSENTGPKTFYAYRDSDRAMIRRVQATVPNPENEPVDFEQVMALVRADGTSATPAVNSQYLIYDTILDAEGQYIAIIDPRGVVNGSVYDTRGRMTVSVEAVTTLPPYNKDRAENEDQNDGLNPVSNSSGRDNSVAARTETDYDRNSNVVAVRHPRFFDERDELGHEKCSTTSKYTRRNLLESQTVAAGAPEYSAGSMTDVSVTMSYTYYHDRRRRTVTDFRGNVTRQLWHACCGRYQGSIDQADHGTISNTDFYGNVTHTAVVENLGDDVTLAGDGSELDLVDNAHDPNNERTVAETTRSYDERHRLVAQTVWLDPLGNVDPNDVPVGPTGPNEEKGLTTRCFYDENLADGIGLDEEGGGIEISRVSEATPESTYEVGIYKLIDEMEADGIRFGGTGSDFHAKVTVNPADEISAAISDGAGRTVATGIIDREGNVITWGTTLHDTLVDIDGFGEVGSGEVGSGQVVETASISALGNINRSRNDAAGRMIQRVDAEGHVSNYQYDGNGNIIQSRDPNVAGQDCDYDLRNRVVSCTDTQGDTTSSQYDKNNNVISMLDAKQQETVYRFDPRDRQVQVTDRLSGVTTTGYDQNSNVTFLLDADNNLTAERRMTSYQYDPRNLKIETALPDHNPGSEAGDDDYGLVSVTWDALRRMKVRTDQSGDTCTYNYDLASRNDTKTYRSLEGNVIDTDTDELTYDDASRLTVALKGRYNNVVTRKYDVAGRQVGESLFFFLRVGGWRTAVRERIADENAETPRIPRDYSSRLAYDVDNRMTEITYPDGEVVHRRYTERDQLKEIDWKGNLVHSRIYDPGSRLETTTHGNGITSTFSYRLDNLIDAIVTPAASGAASHIGNYSYDWDSNKNKTREQITGDLSGYGNSTDSSEFDDEDRLLDWTTPNLQVTWERSLVGDWLTHDYDGNELDFNRNAVHESDSWTNDDDESTAFAHDPKGNLTLDIRDQRLKWDYDNHLVEVRDSAGELIRGYQYDALGRRVSEYALDEATLFVCLGSQVLSEYKGGVEENQQLPNIINSVLEDSETSVPFRTQSALFAAIAWTVGAQPRHNYVYASYVDEVVLKDTQGAPENNGIFYYSRNQQYSVVGLSDSNGEVVERYAYSPYGRLLNRTESDYDNPYTFTGRRTDYDSGLMYFRARYYDPQTGEFISRDPLGYVDGMSQYRAYFVPGATDPSGNMAYRCQFRCNAKSRGHIGFIAPITVNAATEDLALALCRKHKNAKDPHGACKAVLDQRNTGGIKICRRNVGEGTPCKAAVDCFGGQHTYIQFGGVDPVTGLPSTGTTGVGFAGTVSPERAFKPSTCKTLYPTNKPMGNSGKSASEATPAELEACLRSHKPTQKYNSFKYNCNTWVNEAVEACGLRKL